MFLSRGIGDLDRGYLFVERERSRRRMGGDFGEIERRRDGGCIGERDLRRDERGECREEIRLFVDLGLLSLERSLRGRGVLSLRGGGVRSLDLSRRVRFGVGVRRLRTWRGDLEGGLLPLPLPLRTGVSERLLSLRRGGVRDLPLSRSLSRGGGDLDGDCNDRRGGVRERPPLSGNGGDLELILRT